VEGQIKTFPPLLPVLSLLYCRETPHIFLLFQADFCSLFTPKEIWKWLGRGVFKSAETKKKIKVILNLIAA
jgi:hypothetical protein